MKKKFLSILLVLTMLFNSTSVLADTNQTVEYEEGITADSESNQDVEFTMSKGSTFTVCLPKEVEIESNLNYTLKAGIYADIDTTHKLVVKPTVDEMVLSNIVEEGKTPKEDITFEVSNIKTEWRYDDTDICKDMSLITLPENQVDVCSIAFEEIPSGKWYGQLPIRIALDDALMEIIVSSADGDSNDLNAVATQIVGSQRESLLNELVASGKITDVSEIDLLANVNCDEFEGEAEVTFQMDCIAEPGDTVVVYHYDEATATWEYISTETVDDSGQISCLFTSFSPVGFNNIGKNHVCTYDENNVCTVCKEHAFNIEVSEDRYQLTDEDSITIDVFNPGGHEIVVSNSDDSVANTTLQGNSIVINAVGEGVTTVTLSITDEEYGTKEVSFKVDISHKYVNGTCNRCGEIDVNQLPAGLYDTNWNMIKSWEYLIDNHILYDNNGVITSNVRTYTDGRLASNDSSDILSGIIILPDGAVELSATFMACYNVTGVVIPSSVQVIDGHTFYCLESKLANIYLKQGNTYFKTVDGILYDRDMVRLIRYPASKTMTSFTLPCTVKTIDSSAFTANKQIKAVILPEGLVTIGMSAFNSCTSLNSVNIPRTVKTIGSWAFSSCPITELTLPDSIESIGVGFIGATKISEIYVPASCKSMLEDKLDTGNRSAFAYAPSSLKVYCGAPSKPESWSDFWNCYSETANPNSYKLTTYWGVTREQFDAL